MKFYELLKKYTNEQIIESLNKNYNNIDDESYLSALDELRGLEPSTEIQDIKIIVEFYKDDLDEEDDKEYLSCDGIGLDEDGKMIRWGIEFNGWKDWLADEIDEKCLDTLGELTILSGIMNEITFNGFSQDEVDERTNCLMDRKKEAEEHPENLISWDKVKEDLKLNKAFEEN